MIRANIGLSRKVTREFQSTGYSVNLEGDIAVALDDPAGALAKVSELFHLAEEALNVEIERDQGDRAIGRRDEPTGDVQRRIEAPTPGDDGNLSESRRAASSNAAPSAGAITNKQAQFVLTLGRRHRLSTAQLEDKIEHVLRRRCSVYDLTKREAGQLIDALSSETNGNGRAPSRR